MEVPSKLDSQNQAAHEIANTVGNYLAGGKKEDRGEYLFFLAASWLFLLGLVVTLSYLMFARLVGPGFSGLDRQGKDRRLGAVDGLLGTGGLYSDPGRSGALDICAWAGGSRRWFSLRPAPGIFYSTIGLGLGSIAAFSLGRWLERHWLSEVVPPQQLKRFRMLMKRQGILTVL